MSKWAKLADDLVDVDEAGDFLNIKTGIYMARIVDVIDDETKEYLTINFDITEGEFKNYFKDRKESLDLPKWDFNGSFIRSYKDSALRFFKGFINAVEQSNEGYNFANAKGNIGTLKGKTIVVVFADTEIPVLDENNNNKPRVVPKFNAVRSTVSLRENKIKVPTKVIALDSDYDKKKYKELLETETHYKGQTAKSEAYHAAADKIVADDDLPF